MWYVKNLPTWERIVRLIASVALAACAYRFWGHPGGILFAVLAVFNTLTRDLRLLSGVRSGRAAAEAAVGGLIASWPR